MCFNAETPRAPRYADGFSALIPQPESGMPESCVPGTSPGATSVSSVSIHGYDIAR